MKVVAFNGSPRPGGNCELLIKSVLKPLNQAGIETEIIPVGGQKIAGCRACMGCKRNGDGRCVFNDDIFNDCVDQAVAADGIIIASPTYFADVTAETKALIDRMGMVTRTGGNLLRRKVGVALVALRRGGGVRAYDTINHLFGACGMVSVGSTYWNLGFGREKGEVLNDEEGMTNMRDLGENMAWLLSRVTS